MPPGGPVFAPSGPGVDRAMGEAREEARPPVPAEAVLSIEAVQRVGLEANGLVRAARSQIDMAEAGVVGAAAYPNPQLTFMGGPQHARIPQRCRRIYIVSLLLRRPSKTRFCEAHESVQPKRE